MPRPPEGANWRHGWRKRPQGTNSKRRVAIRHGAAAFPGVAWRSAPHDAPALLCRRRVPPAPDERHMASAAALLAALKHGASPLPFVAERRRLSGQPSTRRDMMPDGLAGWLTLLLRILPCFGRETCGAARDGGDINRRRNRSPASPHTDRCRHTSLFQVVRCSGAVTGLGHEGLRGGSGWRRGWSCRGQWARGVGTQRGRSARAPDGFAALTGHHRKLAIPSKGAAFAAGLLARSSKREKEPGMPCMLIRRMGAAAALRSGTR